MAYRKTNTKGETAPNGYHYMSDDSLMSDEEHERVYGKPFAYSKNTSKMGLYCTFYGGSMYGAHIVSNPIDPGSVSATQIATFSDMTAMISSINPAILPPGSSISGSSAKSGNYVYNSVHLSSVLQGIIKMQIIGNSLSFSQFYDYTGPSGILLFGAGLCAKDQDTLLGGSHVVTKLELQTSGTVVDTLLFSLPAGYICMGDLIYRPSDDTIIISVIGTSNTQILHYTYNGTLIDSFDITYIGNSITMFCYDGDIYFNSTSPMYKVGTYPLSITQVTNNDLYQFGHGDGATNPECCDGSAPPPTPNSWDCEITARQSQAPYAPIYGCVEKFAPQVGQYPTQQDCINSHCGGPEPVTVQCSQCNNGFAVSNIFQGTSCPQGWQLASLGDPCKPPIGLIPTDPVIIPG